MCLNQAFPFISCVDVHVQWVIPPIVDSDGVILYLYGGGFVCGSPEDDLGITTRLAAWTRKRVCVPRYRLSPEHSYPVALNDVTAVYRALANRDRGTSADSDTSKNGHLLSAEQNSHILVVGQSAGGNLALRLVMNELGQIDESPESTSRIADKIPALVLLSPWIDLTHSGRSHSVENLDPTLSVEHFLKPASAAYCGKAPTNSPDVSPLLVKAFPTGFPQVFISTGTRDCLYSDSERLATRLLDEANAEVVLDIADKMWHVYEWDPSLPESAESIHRVCNFLLSHC